MISMVLNILFKGESYATYKQFDSKGNVEILDPMKINEFVIYDYFDPDMIEILLKYGIAITYLTTIEIK